MKKKFLALVMTLSMVLSLVPMTALATGDNQVDTVAAGSQSAGEDANGGSQDSSSTTGGNKNTTSGEDSTNTPDTNTNNGNKGSESENAGGTESGGSSTSGTGTTEGGGTGTGGGTNSSTEEKEPPTEPEGVAKIGENYYQSMNEAFQAAKPGDTIVLLEDITGSVQVRVPRNFDGVLTVDLNNHYIDGNNVGKCIWQVNAQPSTLIVENGTLKNGDPNAGIDLSKQSPAAGSAIQINMKSVSLEIINCTFENNKDSAVMPGSDLTVINCKFINNHIRESLSNQSGGAIKLAGNNSVTIKNSEFIDNSAPSMGGAVYVDHGTLDITDCTFEKNSAGSGGAIATSSTVANIKNTTFSQNKATTTWGGAIYVQYSTTTPSKFTQLTMTDNSAPYGGAISAVFVNVALDGIDATENTASAGGFLANYQSTTTISNCTIKSNHADIGGGLYLFDFTQSQATITGGSLINNNATKYAADIFSGATASLTIPATVSGTLAKCNHPIDGWYYDKKDSRWNAHDKDNRYVEQYIPSATEKQEEVAVTQAVSEETSEEPVVQPAPLALKAAHGLMYDVVYKVSGDAPEGYTAPAKQTLKANEKYTVAEVPASVPGTKEGVNGTYSFSGWKTADGTTLTGEQGLTGDVTLYGVWTFTKKSSSGGHRPSNPTVTIPDDVPTGLNGKDHYAYVVGYPDGMVYPQKNITRAEVATIFFRLLEDETREANMTKSNSYNDMKDGAWYTCAVSTLSKMGIIKGYEDGSFKPDASISRAEFAAIAARFDPDGDKTPATFSDVSSHWAKDEISIAANHGWIKGYEDGSFKPDQKITRAETMTLVNRVLKRLPETKDDLHKDMKTWPDNQNESAWFYLAVQEATNSHYQNLKKDGTHEKWESMRETRDWAALEK